MTARGTGERLGQCRRLRAADSAPFISMSAAGRGLTPNPNPNPNPNPEQVVGGGEVTGRKADVQLAAWTVRLRGAWVGGAWVMGCLDEGCLA